MRALETTISRLREATVRVASVVGEVDPAVAAARLGDDALLAALGDVAEARKALDVLGAVYSAEVERRSARELGYSGLAQRTGHRTATSLIQNVTGASAVDVRRATSLGQDLVAVVPAGDGASNQALAPWFAPLTQALSASEISRDQYDAIRRGLGEPPIERYPERGADATADLWREAATVLIAEAADQVLEDLRASARLARDVLDPLGTQLRADERHEKRAFTLRVDESGQHCGFIRFDDDGAAAARTIVNAMLRPRRGPRFVESGGEGVSGAGGSAVAEDSRSNAQLQYDMLMALLTTAAQANPSQVYGDRQPGVRIVVRQEDLVADPSTAVGVYEETGASVSAAVLQTYLCNAGSMIVTVDASDSPLDVGRDRRLFTRRQRIALALRDGGCLWCGAEPSRCEAHHIDHWYEHHGRTDTRDGVLLCRNCHMRLHNQRRRIRRRGDEYWLEPPSGGREEGGASSGSGSGSPQRLRPRSPLRFTALRTGVGGGRDGLAGSSHGNSNEPTTRRSTSEVLLQ